MKRVMDVVLVAIGLALLSPLLLLIAIAIKLEGKGPVLFRQERVGRHFRPFRIYKFRTMVVGAERLGPGLTVRDDRRVTRLGRFLRDSKLDELPQLFNVLKGDMSLVGPRPELRRYVDQFPDDYREILKVRPGITDLASLTYRRESSLLAVPEDAEATYLSVILPEKIRLARISVERTSALHDLGLILGTVIALAYPARLLDRLFDRLGRHHTATTALIQGGLAVVATLTALRLDFNGSPPAGAKALVLTTLPLLLVLRLAWLRAFDLYNDVWQFVGIPNLGSLAAAVALSSASFWLLLRWPLGRMYPVSILLVDSMLCAAGWGAARMARRVHRELSVKVLGSRRVLVVGDGSEADRVLRELENGRGHGCRVIGIVGSESHARGLHIRNVPILGTYDQLDDVLRAHPADEILVVASAAPPDRRRDLIRHCRASGRPVKVVTGLEEALSSGRTKPVVEAPEPEDFLFRDPVQVDLEGVRACFRGRAVLVTGAGGSIGSEICRQIATCAPSRLVLFEKHEESLFHLERELRGLHPDLQIAAVIGDVRDASRVAETFEATRPAVVFHAAAYKHVPMMERNPSEAVKTNVLGTKVVAEAARDLGVETFVLISTDKAVNPVCVMGASKRMAELTLQGIAARSLTRFLTVRFGNVLGSSGSVIPIFREQIETGRPITVTHPDVARWFMTVPEAVQLILEAVTIGRGGEVFVLDMGKPVKIADLARSLIRQYGLRPGKDVPIVYTGLRPGERLFEKLFNDNERVLKTTHPRILMAVEPKVPARASGNGAAHVNGNGNGNGAVHSSGNGNGNGAAHVNGNGNGAGASPRVEELRRLMAIVQNAAERNPAPGLEKVAEELAEAVTR